MSNPMQTKALPEKYDCLAPDQSEIRLLAATEKASTVHCTLLPGKVSLAVAHRTVEEIWFFLEGEGEMWRKVGDDEEVTAVAAGVSLMIPVGAHFQFRNTGSTALRFLCMTIPPWPGGDEAYRVPDHW